MKFYFSAVTQNKESMSTMGPTLVQYVVVRGDLAQKWPGGALIAQACHACSAAIHLYYDAEHTKQYLKDVNQMHKVVLETSCETNLCELSKKLTDNEIEHKLWVEQPENYPTCLATRPYPKEDVHRYFKHLSLYK